MKYGSITSRRCPRCGTIGIKPPDGGLCANCSQNWKLEGGKVKAK